MKCSPYTPCPWVQVSQEQDYYICLRCDKEKRLNYPSNGFIILILLFLFAIVITVLIG